MPMDRELRQYDAWGAEAQRLRAENQRLRLELLACRPVKNRLPSLFRRLCFHGSKKG